MAHFLYDGERGCDIATDMQSKRIERKFDMAQNPIVTFETTQGTIEAELYPEIAPNTVNNFLSLVGKGFYDGLIFHRVINGFMIQGGDPDGVGTGGPGYSIKGEFAQNGFANDLKHSAGVLSMARSMMPDSAGSQFFIMHKDAPHLDGAYAAFGKVTKGQDIVDKIAEVETDFRDAPLEPQMMIKVTADRLSGAGEVLGFFFAYGIMNQRDFRKGVSLFLFVHNSLTLLC